MLLRSDTDRHREKPVQDIYIIITTTLLELRDEPSPLIPTTAAVLLQIDAYICSDYMSPCSTWREDERCVRHCQRLCSILLHELP